MAAAACTLLAPDSALAAGAEGDRWGFLLTVGRIFNLALVIGVLVWVARKPLAGFFSARSRSIRDQLAEAQQAREEAEARLQEIQARMSRLDDELQEIKEAAERDAEEEYRRLIAEAERDAEKIIERARREIEGMTRAAHIELRSHAADLAVELAEKQIRRQITEQDRRALFARFVEGIGGRR